MKSLRILTITNCPLDATLGSGKTVLRYSQGLRDRGHTVDVLQPSDYEKLHGIGKGKRFRQYAGAWQAVRDRLAAGSYDILECYGAEFWLAIEQLSRRRERPLLVAHTNGLELLHMERERAYLPPPASLRGRLKRLVSAQVHEPLMRKSFLLSDCFVALCESDRRYVVEHGLYPADKTAVVEPGLDPEFVAGDEQIVDSRPDRVAFTGSWTARKGTAVLVRVMTEILDSRPLATLDIFGAHADRTEVTSSFPESVRARVHVHAPLTNKELAENLSAARVFFFPTQYEGYGMALAEAMACGCAAVTTPTGFGADLKNDVEALVCGFNDEPGMVRSIGRLLDDADLRLRLAQAGRERTRMLRWEPNIDKLAGLYLRWQEERLSPP